MRTQGVVRHKIVKVHQRRVYNCRTRTVDAVVDSIELDNGVELRPVVTEWENIEGYGVDFAIYRPTAS